MLTPPLKYPVTVLVKVVPLAVALTTNNSRVPAVTLIASPVAAPVNNEPTGSVPVSVGVNVTAAPAIGEKILLGVAEE